MSAFTFVIKDFWAQPKLDRVGKTDSLKAWSEELLCSEIYREFWKRQTSRSKRRWGEKEVQQKTWVQSSVVITTRLKREVVF